MRPAVRWTLRIALLSVALVGLILGAALIAIHTDWARGQLRSRAEQALASSFPGARIGSIEGSALGELVLRDVEFRAADGSLDASVETLRLRISLWALLEKTAHIDSVLADGVVLAIGRKPARSPSAPSENSEWSVELPEIDVRHATVTVDLGTQRFDFDDVALTGSASFPSGKPITTAAKLRAVWRQRAVSVHASAALVIGDAFEIPRLEATVGGVTVTAADVQISRLAGRASIRAPADAVSALVPSVKLPGDLNAEVAATTRGGETRIEITGTVGRGSIYAAIAGELATNSAHALVSATGIDLSRVGSSSDVIASLSLAPSRVHGTVFVRHSDRAALAAIDWTRTANLDRVGVLFGGFGGAAERGLELTGVANVERTGPRANVHAIVRASGADAGGVVAFDGVADGLGSPFAQAFAPAITGRVRATGVRFQELAMRSIAGTIAVAPDRTGSARLAVRGARRDKSPLGEFVVDARYRRDRKLAVSVIAQPVALAARVEADAVVSFVESVNIALGKYRVIPEVGPPWVGAGGAIHIDDDAITFRGLRTASQGASLALDATIMRATGAAEATIDARDLSAAIVDPAYRGKITARAIVSRRDGQWRGDAELTGRELSIVPGAPAIELSARVGIDGSRVTIEGHASGERLGRARVAAVIDRPSDVVDPAAWQKLTRRSLRSVEIHVDDVDLAVGSAQRIAGALDANLTIRDGSLAGGITVRNLPTLLGELDLAASLTGAEHEDVAINAVVRLGTLAEVDLSSIIAVPERPLDPRSWRGFAGSGLRTATLTLDRLPIDLALWNRLCTIKSALCAGAPYKGRLSATAMLNAADGIIRANATISELKGGKLVSPVGVEVDLAVDSEVTRIDAVIAAATPLAVVHAQVPMNIDGWLREPLHVLAAPIDGTVTIPNTRVRDVLALLGRRDVTEGTLQAEGKIAGTLRAPTGNLAIAVRDVRVPPVRGRPSPTLETLDVIASWRDRDGTIEIAGRESDGATLRASAIGRPDQLWGITGKLVLERFDLAPIAPLLPGRFVGMAGRVDANLAIQGIDVVTGKVRGSLAIARLRFPIAPTIGTLRSGDVALTFSERGFTAKLRGRLGRGSVELDAQTENLDTKTIAAELRLRDVSPIGAFEPSINARVTGTFSRTGMAWLTEDLTIRDARVTLPLRSTKPLLPELAPEDIVFVDGGEQLATTRKIRRFKPPPVAPLLIASVTLQPTRIEAERLLDGVEQLLASMEGKVVVTVGDGVGMSGTLELTRADVAVFGHRYRLDHGFVVFEKLPDPELDLRLFHEFPEGTMLYIDIIGTATDPKPSLSSDPGIYSQDQLTGFLLGGSPGGETGAQTREAATSATAAVLSTRFGRRLQRVLPFGLKPRCVPASGLEPGGCGVGRWWLDGKMYVGYRYRLDTRPDEDTNEILLEYLLSKRFVLEGTAGDLPSLGADVVWRKRW